MSRDLRRFQRTPTSFLATITRSQGQVLNGELTSASMGGAYIVCDNAGMIAGESCQLSIILSDGQMSIDGIAEICYLQADGIGIRFEAIDPSSHEHLVRLMMFHVKRPEQIRVEVHRMHNKKI